MWGQKDAKVCLRKRGLALMDGRTGVGKFVRINIKCKFASASVCSIIVHLHLNRPQCSALSMRPEQQKRFLLLRQSKCRGKALEGFLHVPLEHLCKGVIHIEGSVVADLRIDHLLIQFGGDLVSFFAEKSGERTNFISVKIDGSHLF